MTGKRTALVSLMLFVTMCLVLGCDDGGTGTPRTNRPPVITSLSADPDTLEPLQETSITCVATDADGDDLYYTWGTDGPAGSGSGATVTWRAPEEGAIYSVWVEVSDGKVPVADTLEIFVTGSTFLVATDGGIMAVGYDGTTSVFHHMTKDIEVLGTRIFAWLGNAIRELDHQGAELRDIDIPPEIPPATAFVVLPDGGFAFVQNVNDSIYFMDAAGAFVTADSIVESSPSSLQSTGGLAFDDRLIMVDTGPDQVFEYNLQTYEGTVLHALEEVYFFPLDIDYSGTTFYVSGSSKVCRFTEVGPVELLCTLPGSYAASLAVAGSYAYVATSAAGTIHKVSIHTGDYDLLVDGLDRPKDIEYIPVEIQGSGP
jgi:hypothetical protein